MNFAPKEGLSQTLRRLENKDTARDAVKIAFEATNWPGRRCRQTDEEKFLKSEWEIHFGFFGMEDLPQ